MQAAALHHRCSFAQPACAGCGHAQRQQCQPPRMQPHPTRMQRRASRTAASSGDPSNEPSGASTRIIGALISVGLTGTIAAGAAQLAHIPLFTRFAWSGDATAHAFQFCAPLLVLEAILLAPTWRPPAALLARLPEGNAETAAAPGGSQQPDSSRSGQQPSGSDGLSSGSGSGGDAAPSFIDLDAVSASGLSLDALQLTLALYQSPALGLERPAGEELPLQVEAALVALRELSKELLQRGLIATVAAGWLADRLYEAGVEDEVQLPGGYCLPLRLLASCGAAVGLVAAFVPAALGAAEDAEESVGAALLLGSKLAEQQRSAQQGVAGRASSGAAGGAGAALAIPAAAANAALAEAAAAPSAEGEQAGRGTADAPDGLSDDDDELEFEDLELDPLLLEYRLMQAAESCIRSAPAKLAYSIALMRALLALVCINAAFVATGSLSATLTVSLVANGAVLAYSRAKRRPEP